MKVLREKTQCPRTVRAASDWAWEQFCVGGVRVWGVRRGVNQTQPHPRTPPTQNCSHAQSEAARTVRGHCVFSRSTFMEIK